MKNLEILVIGDSKVGKTTLINKMLEDPSPEINITAAAENKDKSKSISNTTTTGKNTLKTKSTEKNSSLFGVGMEVHKKEHVYKNGDTVRLAFWDPCITMLPKEKIQMKLNEKKAKQEK